MKFKKGDRVHLGHKKKGGAGVTGKITEIEDDKVFIVADDGREYRGQVKYLSKPANEKIMEKVYKYLNEEKDNYFIEVELRDAKKALDILKDEKIKHKTDGTNKYLFSDEDEYFTAEDAFKRAKVKIDSKKEPK